MRILSAGGAVILAAGLALPARAAETSYSPKPVKFEATQLDRYSDRELVDLMAPPSFAINVAKGARYYDIMPPDFDVPRPAQHGFAETSVAIWLDPDPAALSYVATVGAELVKRHPSARVMNVFLHSTDRAQRAWMLDALANMSRFDPKIDGLMRPFLKPARDDTSYFATVYFGRKCEPAALKTLLANYDSYPLSSIEKAGLAGIFGVCKYRPAAPALLSSLDAAVLNLAQQSHSSLLAIYPDAKITAPTAGAAKAAWQAYFRNHPQ